VKATVEIDKASEKRVLQILEDFAKKTQSTVEDGVKNIGRSVAKELANKVQPFGLSPEVGQKFEKSIAAQVSRAWIGTNLGAYPPTNDIRQAHYAIRASQKGKYKGTVPKRLFRRQQGLPWLDLIPKEEMVAYRRQQQKKAGRAKGAWIEAGNQITGKALTKIPKWIDRHASGGYGSAVVSGKGMKTQITLTNKTPYLRRIQWAGTAAKAVAEGVKNGLKYMDFIIKGEIEKANKLQ
jgi:hypothetical protein